MSHLLGASAFCYFAFYLVLPNGSAAYFFALVSLSLVVRSFFKPNETALGKHALVWALILIAFGAIGLASIAYHKASINLVDEPLHFLVVGLLALVVLRYRIDVLWVQAGVVCGTLAVLWMVLNQYTGGRFAPTMNATKFGTSIAFQAALCFSLAALGSNNWIRALLVVMGWANVYFVSLTGTRGAFVALALYGIVFIVYIMGSSYPIKAKIVGLGILSVIISAPLLLDSVQGRLKQTLSEYSRIQAGDYSGSVGHRLVMYEAGIQAAGGAPLVGMGYDYKSIFESFSSSNQSKLSVAGRISVNFQNFHNVYVDTLVKRGLLGLLVLFGVFLGALYSSSERQFLLMLPPVAIVAGAGLTDSVFELGITTSYFVIATTLLKCVAVRSLDGGEG